MVLSGCPHCQLDTAGNHAWSCPFAVRENPRNEKDERIAELEAEVERLRGHRDMYRLEIENKRLREAFEEILGLVMPEFCELCEEAERIAQQALKEGDRG